MKTLYVIDNKKKAVVESFQVNVKEPHQVIMCKDRKSKQRYIMVRTENSDPFNTASRQLFKTNYCQYDDVSIDIR